MTPIIKMYMDDTSPNVFFTITRVDGSIVDLTNAEVHFIIQDPVTHLITNSAMDVCEITDAENGICKYAWNENDLPSEGLYESNIRIFFGDGQEESKEVYIDAHLRL